MESVWHIVITSYQTIKQIIEQSQFRERIIGSANLFQTCSFHNLSYVKVAALTAVRETDRFLYLIQYYFRYIEYRKV